MATGTIWGEGPVIEKYANRARRGRRVKGELKHALRALEGIQDDIVDAGEKATVEDRDPDDHGDPGQRGGEDPTAPFTEALANASVAVGAARTYLEALLALADVTSRTSRPADENDFPKVWDD